MTAPTIAGAIDIGTNSVKVTVGRREPDGTVTVLLDQTEVTRLGKNVDKDGRLDAEAVARTVAGLARLAENARQVGAHIVQAVGTSALRDATNGAEFVSEAERVIGGKVEVIAGEREADLVYRAGRRDPALLQAVSGYEIIAATDVGGGSTEVVIGQDNRVVFRESLQLGAVRLTERAGLLQENSFTGDQLEQARAIADAIVQAVPMQTGRSIVVASGGTAANLGAMHLMQNGADLPAVKGQLHGLALTGAAIEERITWLATLPLSERKQVPGLEPDRADVIVAGAIVQLSVLRRLGADTLLVSLRGLRYGLLYELLAL